jgi:hypothetical protein
MYEMSQLSPTEVFQQVTNWNVVNVFYVGKTHRRPENRDTFSVSGKSHKDFQARPIFRLDHLVELVYRNT